MIQPKDILVMVTAPANAKNLLKYVETIRSESAGEARGEADEAITDAIAAIAGDTATATTKKGSKK